MNEYDEARVSTIAHLKSVVREQIREAKTQQASAQIEANSHVGAMESRYDTFKEEAQYLVQSQKLREVELESGLAKIEEFSFGLSTGNVVYSQKVRVGAFVTVEDEEESKSYYFIAPYGGGEKTSVNGHDYLVITPSSPVGRALMGLSEDESSEIRSGKTKVEIVVTAIR